MLNERKLTKTELDNREEVIMNMKKNKRALVKKYGKDAEAVMYGRATNIAKNKTENMNQDKVREMIKDSLKNPKAADLNKDVDELVSKNESVNEGKFKVDDLVYNKRTKTVGIVRMGDDKYGEVKTDADGNVDVDELEKYNPIKFKHQTKAKVAPSTEKEVSKRGLFNPFKNEPVNEGIVNENKQEAFDELQMIMDQLYELSDQAKMIFRNNFPGEYRRLDAYGALDFGTSSNRYDVTLEGTLENLDMEDDDEDMMQEDLDLGHQDNEPHMLKGDLYRIGKYAMELYQMMDDFEGQGEVDFPHWWQSKISNAKSAIVGAKHYLDFELKEPQIDAVVDRMDDITPEMEVDVVDDIEINEETPGKADMVASAIQKAMNKHKGDESKTYQLQQARKAMNKGDLDKAEKIAKRLAEKLKSK